MSIRATSPFPIYLDADGTPLTGGYVYFGISGANPETTPQAVFWDEALSIPAAQPIRTINGFLMRDGSPASVYMLNPYSILVRNKNLMLLYSSLNNPGASESVAMAPVVSAATLAAGLTALGFSAFIQTLIAAADAAAARATLAAVGLVGAEAIEGVKTFSDGIIADVTGNVTGTVDNAAAADETAGIRETGINAELLKCKIVPIGDWNMESTASVSVAHGLTKSKIRYMDVSIRDDDDTVGFPTPVINSSFAALSYHSWDATNVVLTRAGGSLASASYNATGYNRGWILIWYVD